MGVLRLDKGAAFIPGALEGEEVEARLSGRSKGGAVWGEVQEIRSPSPHRLAPPCPYHADCGGCQLLHASYAHQLDIKAGILARALTPLFRQDADIPGRILPALPAPDPYGYRNKGIFAVGRPPVIGFYGRRSKEIAGQGCPALFSRPVNVLLDSLARWLGGAAGAQAREGVRHVLIRESKSSAEIVLVLIGEKEPPWLSDFVEAFRPGPGNDQPIPSDYALSGIGWLSAGEKSGPVVSGKPKLLWGSLDTAELLTPEIQGAGSIPPLRFRLSPEAFFQVNTLQANVLYNEALRVLDLRGDEILWDLYCGSGTLSLFLACGARAVLGVDLSEASIRDAWGNAAANCGIQPGGIQPDGALPAGIQPGGAQPTGAQPTGEGGALPTGDGGAIPSLLPGRVCFLAGAAESLSPSLLSRPGFLADLLGRQQKLLPDRARRAGLPSAGLIGLFAAKAPDAVVLDPPAKGVKPAVLEAILAARPEKILYLSCDPATLARDLLVLVNGGAYRIDGIRLVDMFPQTAHMETMVLLRRLNR